VASISGTPDGKRLLLTVASGSNAALDMFPFPLVPGGIDGWNKTHPLGAAWDSEEGRADILSFYPDGTDEKVYAMGIRNPTGITIQPATGQLWAVVNERDGLGDNTPLITRLMSRKAPSMAGQGFTSVATKIRAMKASTPTCKAA
jgi:glucose/arabinose dehydrogenase